MNIGISGASGQLGASVLKDLIGRKSDHRLVGITRSPERAESEWTNERRAAGEAAGGGRPQAVSVEWRFGDYDRPESLAEAYAGLDRLLLIPSPELAAGRRAEQLNPAIDAAIAAGVGRIVLLSSTSARGSAVPSNGSTYWSSERHLIRGASDWQILRMGYFAETFAQEAAMAAAAGSLTGLAENRAALVSRDDVAGAAAGLLVGEFGGEAVYQATGPASLSGAQRARLVAAASGRPVAFAALPADTLRAQLAAAGLPEESVSAILDIQRDFADGRFDIVTGDVEHLSGRAPRSLERVLAEAFAGSANG
ncbi:NAD(P)H-binding protein [Saccharibacillus sp. CPCC 101409]|uniref:NAD(P)H-binding protein n=1 Tax=Saccharibacillus sp. CPCC 101409 TaxID=3058041 RepID=UPI002672B14A|nr:NAD(P)H-binding protein [Saccharibacillus sp. CPCC 101409]MDO3408322.1 NAD(P)H-binding protein [Saccharibacillus sp. CPCC 101409]